MTAGITIVGLGPGNPEHLTRAAWTALSEADEIHLRTWRHPLSEHLSGNGAVLHSFDDVYEETSALDQVYHRIADQVLELGERPGGVLYAVPGDPNVGEATVPLIRQGASERGLTVRLIPGVSFVESSLRAVGIDGLDGTVIVDALELAGRHHPGFSPESHVIVGQIHSRLVASDVKLTLMNQYPDEHQVLLVRAAGTEAEKTREVPLFRLDQEPAFDDLTTLYVPPMEAGTSFEALQEIVAHLRAPDGCPWDREQTHQSLRQHLLEEAYETLDALDREDYGELREELGDLMLQLVIQTQIATEGGTFQMADVLRGIHRKLVRRHPHVFGDVDVEDVSEVLHNWESLKAEERREGDGKRSAMGGVPLYLPALAQADELQSRAARLGFDWPEAAGVVAKVREELAEVEGAGSDREREAEIGDLLFAVVNLARWLEVDPEAALRTANTRFRRRFAFMEEAARSSGRRLEEMALEELEAMWQRAKAEVES